MNACYFSQWILGIIYSMLVANVHLVSHMLTQSKFIVLIFCLMVFDRQFVAQLNEVLS